MAGLYGDLQGIAGRSLQEIAGLEVPLLDGLPSRPQREVVPDPARLERATTLTMRRAGRTLTG